MSIKQEVKDVFDGKDIGRVLCGFWFHFSPVEDIAYSAGRRDVWQVTLDGHRKYWKEQKPEIFKIMSDGYFTLPNLMAINVAEAKELRRLHPLDENDLWYKEQIELVKGVIEECGEDALALYTIFSPLSSLFFSAFAHVNRQDAVDIFTKTLAEDPGALRYALDVVSKDLLVLLRKLYAETKIDGVYYSVRTYQGISKQEYRDIAEERDRIVLDEINRHSDYNILHICGYNGLKNDLELYQSYPAKVYNWDAHIEGLSLSEGKKFFGGKTVLGGFDNRPETLLHTGSREEIENKTRRLIAETGLQGFIVGADCTVPNDISFKHLSWVRNVAASSHEDRK